MVIGWSCGKTLALYGMLVHVISVHLTGPLFASVKIDFGRVTEEVSTSGDFFQVGNIFLVCGLLFLAVISTVMVVPLSLMQNLYEITAVNRCKWVFCTAALESEMITDNIPGPRWAWRDGLGSGWGEFYLASAGVNPQLLNWKPNNGKAMQQVLDGNRRA